MKNKLRNLFVALAALTVLLSLVEIGSAQNRRIRAVSKQQVEQLLEIIEERNDAFTKTFDEALDDSRLDTSRTEERYTDRSRDLENATDELRREFDHNDTRGENLREARNVLRTASTIDRIMARRSFSRQAENNWLRLKTELNALARIYNIPAVGARGYR